PREGIISFRNAEAGNYAQAGTHLFTIVDNSALNLDCYVSEYDAALLNTGETVAVFVESLVKKYNGKITFVSPDKNRENKNYMVRVALNKTDGQLKSGMFARGTLRFLQKDKALFVNRSALLELNGKQYAFVLGDDKKVHRKPVQSGIRNTEYAEIVSGLQAGDRVITDNITRLREGIQVTDLGKKEDEK
ncbi:MAG: efflux RND transporter periplasmic adaptor subunit, partial [Acidaminococcaceae bacterium]|nr:efflux RND transporter periplasmic adaptor subunit [Acidaminococcaceae bacterium]